MIHQTYITVMKTGYKILTQELQLIASYRVINNLYIVSEILFLIGHIFKGHPGDLRYWFISCLHDWNRVPKFGRASMWNMRSESFWHLCQKWLIQFIVAGKTVGYADRRKVMNGDSHEIALMCQSLLCPFSFPPLKTGATTFRGNMPYLSTVPLSNLHPRIEGANWVQLVTRDREDRINARSKGYFSSIPNDTGVQVDLLLMIRGDIVSVQIGCNFMITP